MFVRCLVGHRTGNAYASPEGGSLLVRNHGLRPRHRCDR